METKESTRKAYKKPQITQVELKTEEAVLQACKRNDTETAVGNKVCGHPGCKDTFGS